jgi:hypothetical protein
MNRRLRSLELMSAMQPFLQGGVITPKNCREIVEDFVKGSSEKLRSFIFSPDIPMQYSGCVSKLNDFIQ